MPREYEGSPDLPAIVFAAPGSGKTRIIVQFALDLLERGVRGRDIVLTTFTREGGKQLQVRLLRKTLGTPLEREAKQVFAGTIDSYALQLLKSRKPEMRNWELVGEGGPASIVRYLNSRHEVDLWRLFPSPESRPWESTGDKVSRFLNHLQYVYNEDRSIAHMRESNPELASAIETYWAELAARKLHDFGTVVKEVMALVDRDSSLASEQSQKYFLVDEAQDLNTNQLLLMESLAGDEHPKLLVVGDDDQQMYAWRGSDPTNLRDALERLGAHDYTLSLNYRSTEDVIEPAHRLIEHNRNRYPKVVEGRGYRGDRGDVTYHAFDDLEDEFDHVVNRINAVVGTRYRRPSDRTVDGATDHEIGYRDVLVLVRRRSEESIELIQHLKRHNIPVDATNVLNVSKHPFGKLVIDSLRYIVHDPTMEKDHVGLKTTRNLTGVLRNEYNLPQEQVDHYLNAAKGFRRNLRVIDEERDDSPFEFAQKVYHGFVRSVVLEGWPGTLDQEQELILGVLSTAVRDFEHVNPRIGGRGLRWLVEVLHDGDGLPNRSPAIEQQGAVRIFTVHNSKGLEADAVILPFATSESYPLLFERDPVEWQWDAELDPPYSEGIEEERNLFYVAMTRSRRFLYVSCTPDDEPPSPFIEEAGLEPAPTPEPEPLTGPAGTNGRVTTNELVASMSDLRLAHGCGYRYKLAKARGFEPGASTQIGYGGSVHLVNELNLNHIRDHGSVLPRAAYEARIGEVTRLPYAWGKTKADLEKGIQQTSLQLWQKWNEQPPRVIDTEVEFTIPLNNVTIIEGRSDALVELPREEGVWNMDLKTRAIKPAQVRLDNPELEWDALTQQIYHLGLQDVAESRYDEGIDRSQMYFSRPDTALEVPTTSSDLDRARDTVEDIAEDIQRDQLEPNPSFENCNACDFKLVCKYADQGAVGQVGGALGALI